MRKFDFLGHSFSGEFLVDEIVITELMRLYDWNEEETAEAIECELAEMIEYDEFAESIAFTMERTLDGETHRETKQYPIKFKKEGNETIVRVLEVN